MSETAHSDQYTGENSDMTADEINALGELVFGNLELYAEATAAHASSKDAIGVTPVTTTSGGETFGGRVGGGGGGVGPISTDIDSLLWDDEEEEEAGDGGGLYRPFAVPRLESDWSNYEGYVC